MAYDLDGNKKFKNETIKMDNQHLDAKIEFENAIKGQVVYAASGNDIIITAYGQKDGIVNTRTVLGKVTLKNAVTEEIVKNGCIELDVNDVKTNLLKERYAIGNSEGKKKQTVKGSYLQNDVYGGSANDVLYAGGAYWAEDYNTLVGNKGADKMYAGEGKDIFIINKDDAVSGDTIYGAAANIDELRFNYAYNNQGDYEPTFAKNGNDIVVTVDKDSVTLNNFFSEDNALNEFLLVYGDGTDEWYLNKQASTIYKNDEVTDAHIDIKGNEKKANSLVGSEFDDVIVGGNKNDKITTGTGDDIITAGKGNDTVVVDDIGHKIVNINKGDGNDTVIYDESVLDEYYPTVDVKFADSDDATKYTYKKDLTDLTITATHDDKKTESVTIKDYYNPLSGDAVSVIGNTTMNEELIKTNLATATTIVESKKASELVNIVKNKYMTPETPYYNTLNRIKVPKDLGNINVFAGSRYDDEFNGTTGKDVMISFGGYNNYTTGKKGQTAIASLGKGHDTYNVTSYTAGSVVVDADCDYELNINGVNTNDIHMYAANNILDSDINAKYMTDTTGIKNLASVNYSGIYSSILNASKAIKVVEAYDPEAKPTKDETKAYKEALSTVNSALADISGVINKFRGVAVVDVNEDSGESESYTFDDMMVKDTKGNEHVIAGNDIALLSQVTNDALGEYLYYVNENYSEEFGEFENITDLLVFLIDPQKDNPIPYTKAQQKDYNAIKTGFFGVFQKLFIGTDGDNSYTITKADGINAYISGKGSDTFTFKGNIGQAYGGLMSSYYGSTYEILSTYEAGHKDTVAFTGYSATTSSSSSSSSSGSGISSSLDYDIEEDGVVVRGVDFGAYTWSKNKNTYANVAYRVNEDANDYEKSGYNLNNGDFELTVKGAKNTYNILATRSDEAINLGAKTNNHIYTFAQNATITSNNGANEIVADASYTATSENHAKLDYTYGGGNDFVASNSNYSDDIYKATLTKNTNLTISDEGYNDYDELLVTDTALSNVKVFFNIDNESVTEEANISDNITMNAGKFAKTNFYTYKLDTSEGGAYAKSGLQFKYSSGDYDKGIESVCVGEDEINVENLRNELNEEIQKWFAGNTKGYADVESVLACGTKAEVNGILAIYNNVDLSNYVNAVV